MMGKKDKKHEVEKVLDVDASMQGSLSFKDHVNLRINGMFEGLLNTKGNLMIGEHASVSADITGESIIVAGKVNGNITAEKELKLIAPACVVGDITTPLLSVAEGAILEGRCKMLAQAAPQEEGRKDNVMMTPEELAKYLEVEVGVISDWVNSGKIPGMKEGDNWRFDRIRIDEWVAEGKIK
ncbi:MAG: polymer-forming cytoskeletal protein [Candidatus Omnitrophica bacterium]|nr:polymer-forming cytoskeletal protein [Candidatus Omnitrophota bacterium]